MAIQEQNHDRPRCGVIFKGRPPCKQHAGHGTTHVGSGACSRHGGGAKGAPAGNKRALKTGFYEAILLDSLDDDERQLAEHAALRAKVDHLNDQIAIATVRLRRMLQRISALKAAGAMTTVEESVETIATGSAEVSDRILSQLSPEEADEVTGAADGKAVTKRKAKQAGTLGQIQAIESDVTAVQTLIARLVAEKHKLENPNQLHVALSGPDGGPVEVAHGLPDDKRAAGLVALLDRARARAGGQLPPTDG